MCSHRTGMRRQYKWCRLVHVRRIYGIGHRIWFGVGHRGGPPAARPCYQPGYAVRAPLPSGGDPGGHAVHACPAVCGDRTTPRRRHPPCLRPCPEHAGCGAGGRAAGRFPTEHASERRPSAACGRHGRMWPPPGIARNAPSASPHAVLALVGLRVPSFCGRPGAASAPRHSAPLVYPNWDESGIFRDQSPPEGSGGALVVETAGILVHGPAVRPVCVRYLRDVAGLRMQPFPEGAVHRHLPAQGQQFGGQIDGRAQHV